MPETPIPSPLDHDTLTGEFAELLRSYVLARLRKATPAEGVLLVRAIIRATLAIGREAGTEFHDLGQAVIAGLSDPPPARESLITVIPTITQGAWPKTDLRSAMLIGLNTRAVEVVKSLGLLPGITTGRLIAEAMGAGALIFADMMGLPDEEALAVLHRGFEEARTSLNERPKKGQPS